MDLMKAVEDRLGAVESWPTHIFQMFVEGPSARTVKNVAAFMYGNDVPLRTDVKCFNACNGCKHSFVEVSRFEWDYVWNRNPYKFHMTE
jgi:hypothetical protein